MPILHKFQNHNWENGFWTENSILRTNHYKPEVLFIGTFNPLTPNNNFADFFYGRNYFWPAFKNLFIENQIIHCTRRMPANGCPPQFLNPTLEDIFEICKQGKVSFADMINSVFPKTEDFNIENNDNIIFNYLEYNLIMDNGQNGIGGLVELNNIDQVEWNIENIIKYLCENPTIKHIYFTRKPSGIWLRKWNELRKSVCSLDRTFSFIYTPSGRRLQTPVMNNLIDKWINQNNGTYCNFNHHWLIQNGVNPNNF